MLSTIGAKEGFSHLMWVLLQPGDAALVPSPTYPIHIWGPYFAGADVRQVPIGPGRTSSATSWRRGSRLAQAARGRAVVPAQPDDGHASTWPTCSGWSTGPASATSSSCTTSPTPTWASTATKPPSILQCEGAKECAVELYSMTKSFSMAGWRVGFLVGNAEVVGALAKLKSYLDYGTFQPIQIAATVTMNEAPDYPAEVNAVYESPARRADRRPRPHRLADRATPRHDVRLGAHPRAVRRDGLDRVRDDAREGGERRGVARGRLRSRRRRFVRFALIENEQRIEQAVRNLKRGLPKLG